tara:strand:+ start:302 stop:1009 length:708 start_codon:yes stop_codon:yes gene_type:complete
MIYKEETLYFGVEQEKQVKQYLTSLDEDIYQNHIHELLRRIAYGMSHKMKMRPASLYRSKQVKDGCVSHLWEQLVSNYNPNKGKKAYSYLTTVAHNYYCGVWRKYHRKNITLYKTGKEIELLFESANQPSLTWNIDGQVGSFEKFLVQKDEENENLRAAFRALKAYEDKNDNSKKVCAAVKILLDSSDGLSLDESGLHKKQIYLYLREITGLKTKQIVNILQKLRKTYKIHNKNH